MCYNKLINYIPEIVKKKKKNRKERWEISNKKI